MSKRKSQYPSYCSNCVTQNRENIQIYLTGYCIPDCKCDGCGRTSDLMMVKLREPVELEVKP